MTAMTARLTRTASVDQRSEQHYARLLRDRLEPVSQPVAQATSQRVIILGAAPAGETSSSREWRQAVRRAR